jgi:predicted TIM-barrel fold metal-dependent hydrolase
LLVAKANPNVNLMPSLWQGTDLFGNERGPNRIQEFIKILHTFRESIGAHRILWGSDYMKGFDKQKSIDWAHFFQNLIQNASEYEYIFSQDEIELMNQENAKRIYHLDN